MKETTSEHISKCVHLKTVDRYEEDGTDGVIVFTDGSRLKFEYGDERLRVRLREPGHVK